MLLWVLHEFSHFDDISGKLLCDSDVCSFQLVLFTVHMQVF